MRIGTTQLSMLRSLYDHGSWQHGCGWVWDHPSGTRRICDSLVSRGLARTDGRDNPTFRLTDAGKKAALQIYIDTAEQHKAADVACGREWVCTCGACRIVRKIVP